MTRNDPNHETVSQLWRHFGLASAFHQQHGRGQVVRVGLGKNGLAWVDVIFKNGHRSIFDEPFTDVTIKAVDKNADTPV